MGSVPGRPHSKGAGQSQLQNSLDRREMRTVKHSHALEEP